ncbi:MAG: aminoglycoside phosphotransferase family protein [Prevotellaceae bacterium]|jgi:Ser/Thr protein kinase RdoA (MazF antagonist)|nr:aminoglycoside phosphotransferase family protein [Prevotellaceae bacterium]
MEELKKVVKSFVSGNDIQVAPLGAGHINDSYKVSVDGKEFVLQKINHSIFKNVPELQSNILRVTSHIRTKLEARGVTDIERRVLNLIPANDGKYYYQDEDGNYWRLMDFIKDSTSFDSISPELAEKAGEAFGDFQDMLSDLPGEPLFETIPDFHNIGSRLAIFRKAVKYDLAWRRPQVQYIIDEMERRAEKMRLPEVLNELYKDGKLPKRINHCDTKVNNILFDSKGKEVLCVVDLDTVMPGFVLSDFGDFIRTGANTGKEDDTILSKVSIDLKIFKAYTKGYLRKAKKFLTETEIEYLAFGARVMTYMQVLRFLTDFLDGDKYYKINYPHHNLYRTLAQWKLLESMENNYTAMQNIVRAVNYETY